jgi:hypothetical protein
MLVNLNFNLEAWVKHLEIDAISEEEAIQKLMGMSLAEIIEAGAVVDSEMKISEIETEVTEYDVTVKVTDIEYDLDSEDMDPGVKNYLIGRLPKELTTTIRGVTESDDLEELIQEKLYADTSYDTRSFKFQILEKK